MSYSTPADLVDLLCQLSDQGHERATDPHAEETFIHCLICNGWEEHTDTCPMPAIEAFLRIADPVPADPGSPDPADRAKP